MKKLILFAIALLFVNHVKGQDSNTTTPVDTTPLGVVQNFLTAYREHNHEKVTALLHPDVIWIQPGENRVSGVKKSRTELLQMGAMLSQLSAKTLTLNDVQYVGTNGNSVACILHWKAAQPIGKVLDVKNIDVYTVENGKIVHVKVYSEDISAENEFWGK